MYLVNIDTKYYKILIFAYLDLNFSAFKNCYNSLLLLQEDLGL